MSDIGKHKLTDALPEPKHEATQHNAGKPHPTHETAAEQVREDQKSNQAHNAEGSVRDKMIDIGRANQQGGRQGQSSSPEL